jgi:hypothetical protein
MIRMPHPLPRVQLLFESSTYLYYSSVRTGVSVPTGIRTQNQAAKGPPALPIKLSEQLSH